MYSYITSQMTWSYSRLTTFEVCPYQFFLKYIELVDEAPKFFPTFGGFLHRLLADFLTGKRTKNEVILDYITRFNDEVESPAPSPEIFSSYYIDGLNFLRTLEMPRGSILGVEVDVKFEIEGSPFIGFVDLVYENEAGELSIIDHKSRVLKPRSKRHKPLKSDRELDEYLRQIYLYSIPIASKYGKNPTNLAFNCYRKGTVVKEPFNKTRLLETKNWAKDCINEIMATKEWLPSIDFFRCKHLCGVSHECEYYQMWGGGRS